MNEAEEIYRRHGFEWLTVSKRIENVAPEGWDRGDSSIHILRSLFGVDWEERVKVIACLCAKAKTETNMKTKVFYSRDFIPQKEEVHESAINN